ncbi:hypothetical protein YPPY63_0742, partial [Yersinia pestis PY-63]
MNRCHHKSPDNPAL